MAYYMLKYFIFVIITLFCSYYTANGKSVKFSKNDIKLEIGKSQSVYLIVNEPLENKAKIQFTYDMGSSGPSVTQQFTILENLPDITVPAQQSEAIFDITALHAGHIILGLKSSSKELQNLESTFIRIDVIHSSALDVVNDVSGWIYFTAWSLSLYSQVYQNWRRKSVVGLNFDFVLYNIFGFFTYSFFNVGLFWIPSIQNSYMELHPRGINPVQLNDVVSSLHAVFVSLVIVIQCCIYERGNQKLSLYHSGLVLLTGLFLLASLLLAACQVITWLTYLYFFSYVEVGVTLIKYVPQAYMNCVKKSTEGWSIGNVFLEFTGGGFCALQMILLAYNSDDWKSITGNLSKMGVAVFTLGFDCVFFVQHYCLYRHGRPDQSEDEETLQIITTIK